MKVWSAKLAVFAGLGEQELRQNEVLGVGCVEIQEKLQKERHPGSARHPFDGGRGATQKKRLCTSPVQTPKAPIGA